jgi:casein kinase II subunit beta
MAESSTSEDLFAHARGNESNERFYNLCFWGRNNPPSAMPCSQFTTQFISSRGNEYFCEIDEEYLTDRFNLTGLNTEVPYYQYALDLVTDVFDLDADDDLREQIEKSARHLYGLVHARYIVTTRGLGKMVCVIVTRTPHLIIGSTADLSFLRLG